MTNKTPTPIFCIPGMGLDGRIFHRLALGPAVQYLNWIEPKSNEPLDSYARRVAAGIPEGVIPDLVGYSFGGILAQEIAALRPIRRIVLLSSVKGREELSPVFKRVAAWRLHLLFSKRMMLALLPLWGRNHGLRKSDVSFFKEMLSQHSNHYYRWGTASISSWARPLPVSSTVIHHIHGTNDRPFPYRYLGPVHATIDGGDHLMLYKQSKVIQSIIARALSDEADPGAPSPKP